MCDVYFLPIPELADVRVGHILEARIVGAIGLVPEAHVS